MTSRKVAAIVMVLAVCLCAGAHVNTQAASGTQDVVFALLTEVRALRVTLETVASASASGQLTLGRLQLQEQRLNAAIAKLETTRERLANTQRNDVYEREQAAKLEAALIGAHGIVVRMHHSEEPLTREQIEEMLKGHRTSIARNAAQIQKLIAEESVLAGDVALEQSRWSDLNRRLEEIEQNLTQRVSAGR